MLGRGDDADDVGQETFIRFHRALGSFRGDSSLKTYLVHIAMNLSLNALKRRRRSLLRFVSRDDRDERHAEAVDLPDLRVGPAGKVDAGELQEFVRAAVARLGEKHRAVVVLRMFHEYSTRETAELLGLPEGTVLSRLSRAMKELETQLRPYARAGAALPEVVR
jgi:RNA polymerase sigma-70 factor, ECF subfamily